MQNKECINNKQILGNKKRKNNFSLARKRETVFYILCIAVPMIQFAIYYIGVNFTSFLLAFQKYDSIEMKYQWVGFENFKTMFSQLALKGSILRESVFTSIKTYFLGLLVIPFTLLFPFYIYKKMPGSEFFKVMLYLPSILSAMVLGLLYQYFVDQVIPEIALKEFGKVLPPFLKDVETRYGFAWAFTVFIGFGGNILIYLSAMSRIPDSLVEYAKLEGCKPFQEFLKITLPIIFPTFATFFVTGVAAFFTNQLGLFTFFATDSTDVSTVGYYVYCLVVNSEGYESYPMASTIGLFFTLIIAPLTLFVRWLMNRLDPNVQY